MGLSIGQVGVGTSVLNTVNGDRRSSLDPPEIRRRSLGVLQQQDDDPRGALLQRAARPVPRTGFGEGTVSTPGAVLDAIDRTARGARQIVPTFEELQQQFQVRAAERRAEARREARGLQGPGLGIATEENRGAILRVDETDGTPGPLEAVGEDELNERGLGIRVESRIPDAAPEAQRFNSTFAETQAAESAQAEDVRAEQVDETRVREEAVEEADERNERDPQNVGPRLDVFA